MGGACGTCGGEDKWYRVLARETLRRETVLKYEAWIGG
jgi:hypothetical protein